MKKLYIPTSTFNFNNILSSESISPKAFYSKRGFGYFRWLPIAENNIEDVILLYDKPFNFSRPVSDIEDHPMLVEIQSEEDFKSIANGMYYCDHTIYLSPWHTRFIFFTEQDKTVALSLSESSLETKMLRLYSRGMTVEQYPNIAWPNVGLENSLNEQAIQQDQRTNKMKGLLYGYYIGALLSSSPEIVRKYNVLQELQNIFSAVLSSNNHAPTITQEEQICSLIRDLQKEIPYIACLTRYLSEPQRIDEVLAELSRLGVSFPRSISVRRIIYALRSTDKDNYAMKWLNDEWKDLHDKEIKERKILNSDKEEVIISEGRLAKFAENVLVHDKEPELVKAWINDILSSNKYNGKVSSFKSALADEVTFKAKDIYAEQWGSSEAKIALNNMRKYLNGSENNFQWNNLLISSIAAVIAKGSDWTELLSFLKSKNIYDYRLAFAFYGELNGFANLTRDFTNLLLNMDREYVASVYKEFAGQLLGVDATAGISLTAPMPMNESALNDQSQADTTTDAQKWKPKVEVYLLEKAKKKKKEEIRTALELLHDDSISTPNNYISRLKQLKGWTRGATSELRDLLLPHDKGNEAQNRKGNVDNQPSLGFSFDDESTSDLQPALQNASERNNRRKSLMFADRDWWEKTADMIADRKARKQYLTDVEWFIENHNEFYNDKKRGSIKGSYSGHSTENDRLLERFRAYLKNKVNYNPKAAWVSEEYSKIPTEKIIQYLTFLYADL